uniref:ATP synthase complex subunit 8 n=1 Tax=Palinurellus wieneckii TaxID=198231 RepID=S4V389_PALWI|nr:ATP synthase F0 subunit 8 [Palinurellus wieneckii]AGN95854.1 ATP synthase F0 subunit 8 [Palinurellus wieneckii]
MPQMSPMLWLNLFIMFLISLACFTILNYFIFCPQKMTTDSMPTKSVEKSWKW